jgi:hypothetical protein
MSPGAAASMRQARAHQEMKIWEGVMELAIAFGLLAAIWVVVLWGSTYFGPKTG